MNLYGVKTVPCTLCKTPFPLVVGAMMHPADALCGACVLDLYDRLAVESIDAIRASVEARVEPRMGMMPDTLASAITDRVERLPDVVQDRVELENMLARRGSLRG